MKLTREEAIQKTRDMWNGMADMMETKNEIITKEEYLCSTLSADEKKHLPQYMCYCCEYDKQFSNNCRMCPIYWPEGCLCGSIYSPYFGFENAVDVKSAIKYAREIANLPEREV